MNQRTKTQVLDDVVQQYSHKDIDLSSRILSKVQKEKVNIMKTRFALTAMLTVAVIMAALFAIPSTATAMKRLFGFIPGIGLVNNDAPMRVLKESAKIEQNGTTISVVQGVVDSQNTTLIYQVENLPDLPASPDFQVSDICHLLPELKLQDGSILDGKAETGESWLSGYSRRIVFPALPAEVNSAQLVFSCLERSTVNPGFPKIELTLDFIQMPEGDPVYTLVDLPTPEPQSVIVSGGEGSYTSDIQLVVDRYVQTDENLILYGNVRSISGNTKIDYFEKNAVHLVDPNGVEIPLTEDPALTYPADLITIKDSISWAYLIESAYSAGQATMTVDSAWVRISDIASFSLDLGSNPQPGEKLVIDQTVNIAGRDVKIQSADINAAGDGISFTITKPEDVSGIILMDFGHPLIGGGGYETYGFTYRDGLPSGEINITLASALVRVAGPWVATVDLPASNQSVTAYNGQPACLTQAAWQQSLSETTAIPEGLGGTLGIYYYEAPDFLYRVKTSSLDGSNQKPLALGDEISLSPDGHQAIHNSDSALQLENLDTQAATSLANTWKNDRGAVWSPDGSKIAFTRGPSSGKIGAPGPYSIIISNPDGTQQESLIDDGAANSAMAWLPDGNRLLYTVSGPQGVTVKSIDATTKETEEFFVIEYSGASVVLSPDGQQVAYVDMLPGDRYAIFIRDLKPSSTPRLVADAAPLVATTPYWSPDGKWLIASVYDETVSEFSTLVLIRLETCQIIPLKNLTGGVSSWLP